MGRVGEVGLGALVDLSNSGLEDYVFRQIESFIKPHALAHDAARDYIFRRIEALETEQRPPSDGTDLGAASINPDLRKCREYLDPPESSLFPEAFKDVLQRHDASSIRVLDVTPPERAQRVSTLASAAASLQTALAIAARFPTAGIGIDSSFANLNAEIGKIEARQRVPLVVGFLEARDHESTWSSNGNEEGDLSQDHGSQDTLQTGRESNAEVKTPGTRFGWVLGPPLVPDLADQELEHAQILKTHDLQVDMSVPAWWPYLELSVRTAWAGPLGQRIEKRDGRWPDEKTMRVNLPRADFDMETFTRFLFDSLTVKHPSVSYRPDIREVTPPIIDTRGGQTTLIIQGPGLWRGEEVFVYGVRQENVSILPDMSGLAVTLNPATYSRVHLQSGAHPLTVFTPAGSDVSDKLKIVDPEDPSSSALPVVSRLPYHIDGASLDIRPTSGSFPSGTSPKIAYRPSVPDQNYAFMEADATLTATRAVASATVNWSGAVTMISGDTLEARYLYRTSDHMAPTWSDPAFLVYYANADEAAATFEDVGAKPNSTDPVRMPLKLPVRAPEAYPLLFDADTQVKATAGTAKLSRSGGRLEVSLTPPEGGFAAGAIKLEFANRKAGDGALPRIEGTLMVK